MGVFVSGNHTEVGGAMKLRVCLLLSILLVAWFLARLFPVVCVIVTVILSLLGFPMWIAIGGGLLALPLSIITGMGMGRAVNNYAARTGVLEWAKREAEDTA